MRRSASASKVSDQFSPNPPPPSPASSQSLLHFSRGGAVAAEDRQQLLPVYHPNSQPAKREKSQLRSAENAIHFIPLVLILCAVILWLFSYPVNTKK